LPAGAYCTINVVFTPSTASPDLKSASLQVDVAAPAHSQKVALTGTVLAPDYTLLPASLTFTNQMKGSTSAPQTVTVTNTSPLANLTIKGISTSAPFKQTNTCGVFPASLAPGVSCTISVTFTPVAAGVEPGTLKVNIANPGIAGSVGLEGAGVVPITSAPTALNFGKVFEGATAIRTLTISNPRGNPDLTNLSVAYSGSDFSTSATAPGSCSSSLAGGASCTVNVEFAPGSSETIGVVDAGTITVSGFQGALPQNKTVSLNGTPK
jgi:hypothetical protein